MATPRENQNDKINRIEAGMSSTDAKIATVATQLGDFIKESRRDNEQMWAAHKEQGQALQAAIERQGQALQAAVEKLSNKGQITWPVICSTVGVILSLIIAGGGINHALTESRIKQLEIREEYMQKELDSQEKRIENLINKP
jgi:hypothetical protein